MQTLPSNPLGPPELGAFLNFIKAETKLALAALLGNAYKLELEANELVIFFDQSRGNLMPMLKMNQNHQLLKEMVARYFARHISIQLKVGQDPQLQKEEKINRETRLLVESNPKVQFVLQRFKGNMVSCEAIKKKE